MTKTLNDFVKDNSKFLKLEDGETFKGRYMAFKVTTSKFDPEKETCVYKLAFEDGKEVYFQTASVAVARTFSKFTGGEKVSITRHGTGNKTSYEIKSPEIHLTDDELQPDEELPPDFGN